MAFCAVSARSRTDFGKKANLLKRTRKSFFDLTILIAILTAGLAFLIMLCLNRFTIIYSTNDDYIMSVLIQNGDDRNIFMNYLLTHLNVTVQRLLPFVNWFSVYQLINSFVAVCAINFVVLKQAGSRIGLFLCAVFDLICISSVMITVHWTQTTAMMCASGFALLFYALRKEERTAFRVIELIHAFFLTVYGSLYRIEGFEMSVLFFFVMCLVCVIRDMAVRMREHRGFFRALGYVLKKYLNVIICSVLIVVLAFSCVFLSNRIKNADPAYQGYLDYNQARSSVNDYQVPSYESNEAFYESIGIHSAEELAIALEIHSDKDFYTAERLSQIGAYAQAQGLGRRSNLETIKSFVKSEIRRLIPIESRSGLLAVSALGGLLLIALCVVLFRFREKLKYLFPALLTFLWILFLKYYGVRLTTVMFLPAVALIVLTVFFCNRYYFTLCSLFSVMMMGFYFYQNFSRIRYRVSYTFILPALVFLLIFLEKDVLQKRFENPKTVLRVCHGAVSVAVCGFLIYFVNTTYINSNAAHMNKGFDRCVQQYVEEHPDTFFVHPYPLYPVLDSSFFNAVIPSDCPENTLIYGDWQMASAYYDNALKARGIDRLFEQIKNSDDKRFLLSLYQSVDFVHIYETYYNAHYAEEGETVRFVEEARFEPEYDNGFEQYHKYIGVYRVVTE